MISRKSAESQLTTKTIGAQLTRCETKNTDDSVAGDDLLSSMRDIVVLYDVSMGYGAK